MWETPPDNIVRVFHISEELIRCKVLEAQVWTFIVIHPHPCMGENPYFLYRGELNKEYF